MFRGKLSKTILLLAIFIAGSTLVRAVTPAESTNSEYLKRHGHSNDVVRLVEIQKANVNAEEIPPAKQARYVDWPINFLKRSHLFFRNLFFESDATLYTQEFGTTDN